MSSEFNFPTNAFGYVPGTIPAKIVYADTAPTNPVEALFWMNTAPGDSQGTLSIRTSIVSGVPSWVTLNSEGLLRAQLELLTSIVPIAGVPAKETSQMGFFSDGIVLHRKNHLVIDSSGQAWFWKGSLPKIVTAGTTPEASGGIGDNKWAKVITAFETGNFQTGFTATTSTQFYVWPSAIGGDNKSYVWQGVFPKVVPENSSPFSTGGVGDNAWLPLDYLQDALENGTANIGGAKASDLAKATLNVPNLKTLASIPLDERRANITYFAVEFCSLTGKGGHFIKWNASRVYTSADIGDVWPDAALNAWNGSHSNLSALYGSFSGTGCWEKVVKDNNGQYEFGAIGGGANDTTPIQRLFSVVGDVSMPAGDHTVTGLTISLADKYVKMSKRCKLTLANGSNANIISISASGVTIKGGYLDGNLTNQSANCSCVVGVGNDILIDGVTAVNGYQFGIQTRGNRNKIKRCNVSNVGYVPILVDSLAGQVYKRNRVQDCNVDQSMRPTSHNGSAITLSGAFGQNLYGRVTGCDIVMPIGATVSNMIGVQTAGQAYHCIVSGNTIEGGFMGISSNGSDFTTIEGNTVISPNTYGIEVAGGKHKTVVGNTVDGASVTNSGIAVTNDETVGDKDYVVITGNIVAHCTEYGISAVDGTNNLTIDSNDIEDINIGAGYGLFLVGVTGLSISDNNLSNGKRAMFLENINDAAISGGQMNGWTTFGIQLRANNTEIDNISITGVTIADDVVNKLNAVTILGTGTAGSNIKVSNNIGIPRDYSNFVGNIYNMVSSGVPEGIQTAGVGSTYQRSNGTAAATLYVKESGTGNTGWVAK